MCPVCLTTAAIIAGSATGTGGLTALVARALRAKAPQPPISISTNAKEEPHGQHCDSDPASQDRFSL
jgi:hypothetical protein